MAPHEVVTRALAREMNDLCASLRRVLGLLVDRRGDVTHVILGDSLRLYLPDIGRLRAGEQRLRGLRLIVSHPGGAYRGRKSYGLESDLITDLEKLQLDGVLQLEAKRDGAPGRLAFGHVMPAQKGRTGARVHEDFYPNFEALDLDFLFFVEDLEDQLQKAFQRVREAEKLKSDRGIAVLVGVYTTAKSVWEASLSELEELCETANVSVADVIVQRRRKIDPRSIVGKGKLEEICLQALHLGAEILIFDRDLSPSQLNAITDMTDLKVLDRTMLILDIFARRATSQAGKLQVELAQLKYALPRLAKKQEGLSRLAGGIGGQGPGETKLEVDRRRARDRLARLEKDIDKLSKQRNLRRSQRGKRNVPVISIVGYTNAGKSTLLNQLTQSKVYAKDELFATLDPTSRRLRFPREREVVITDTVGFIRDLPDSLVNAFRATLEELDDSDLLLHVIDAADPLLERQMQSVEKVLRDLKLDEKPRLLVFNKCDQVHPLDAERLGEGENAVAISALNKEGFKELLKKAALYIWPVNSGSASPSDSSQGWSPEVN